MQIWEWIKSHPATAIIIGVVVFVGVLFLTGSGGSVSQGNANTQAAQDTTQQDQINAALSANAMNNQAALEANSNNNATQVALANIAKDIAAGQFAVQSQSVSADLQAHALDSTLAAQVQEAQISASTQQLNIATQGSVATTKLFTDALIAQSNNQAQSNQAAINAQTKIATQSWVSKIFG